MGQSERVSEECLRRLHGDQGRSIERLDHDRVVGAAEPLDRVGDCKPGHRGGEGRVVQRVDDRLEQCGRGEGPRGVMDDDDASGVLDRSEARSHRRGARRSACDDHVCPVRLRDHVGGDDDDHELSDRSRRVHGPRGDRSPSEVAELLSRAVSVTLACRDDDRRDVHD